MKKRKLRGEYEKKWSIVVPNNIRNLRMFFNLYQKQFGKMFGVSESTISYWESGKRKPKEKTRLILEINICEYLET